MKKCLFCAADIQDAAIACQHCGRDLPPQSGAPSVEPVPPRASKRTGLRWFMVSLLALMVVAAFLNDKLPRSGTEGCSLHARAAVVTRDNPIAHAFKWDTDMLTIRNLDSADWTSVEVTIYGSEKYSKGIRQPTSAYKRTKSAVPAKGLAAFSLDQFAQPDGGHWVSMTIAPENVDVEALRGGRACTAELSVSTSASDAAVRESR